MFIHEKNKNILMMFFQTAIKTYPLELNMEKLPCNVRSLYDLRHTYTHF